VVTAGPQPRLPDRSGHCRTSTASQWALPDLNRELQIPVGTAGPQRQDRMPEDMPDRMPEDISDRMPEDLPDRMPEDMPEDMPEHMPEDMPEHMPENMSDRMPEDMSDRMPEDLPDRMPEDMPEDMPDRMPENMSDRMPEDLPVRKCINAMVGIIRSEVFFIERSVRSACKFLSTHWFLRSLFMYFFCLLHMVHALLTSLLYFCYYINYNTICGYEILG